MAITYSAGDNNSGWNGGSVFNGSSSQNNYGFYIGVRETYVSDSSNNYSNIAIQIGIKNNGTRFSTNGWCFKYTVDGVVCDYQTGVNIGTNYAGYYDDVRPITIDGSNNRGMYANGIPHNDNGSKTVHIKVEMYNSTYGSYTPGYCVVEGDFPLTTIPRASSPSATTANIEETMTIYTNRQSDSFTHTLTYQFGSLSGTIATGVGVSTSWTVPSSFYAQIPNSQSGNGTIYCTTYNGGTQIAQAKSCSFTVYASKDRVKPTVSVVGVDTNKTLATGNTIQDLTGDSTNKTIIKGISNVQVSLTAAARGSSSISATQISAGTGEYANYSGNFNYTFNNVSTSSFTGKAVDTRSYDGYGYVNDLTMLDYTQLSISPVRLYRTNQTSNNLHAEIDGNYFKGGFNNTANTLSLKFKYKESGTSWPGTETWTSLTPTISQSENKYSFDGLLGSNFDYTKIYDFVFKVEDLALVKTYEVSSTPGIPIIGIFEDMIEVWGEKFVYK